jgi:anti-sigma regulatory factor (Ser/Thr protein kinase)
VDSPTEVQESVSVTLHPHPHAVATARRFAASVTAHRLDDARQRDLSVLVSELVTNGVVHAATTMELIIGAIDGVVRVELVDHSGDEPHIRPETGADGGFGLRIVEAMARRWGVRHEDGAKTVWFEL